MKKFIVVAGIAAVASVTGIAALYSAPASEADDAIVQARFEDGPTGFRFVWERDTGWTFVGQAQEVTAQELAAASLVKAPADSQADGNEPLAVFVEDVTGYRFAWSQDAGWRFAGGERSASRQF